MKRVMAILIFAALLGGLIMSIAKPEEHIVNGSTNIALVFDVYGASSGDPCLVATDITTWNLQYYREGAANKDVNNATAATLGTHADNKIVALGAGKFWACFPDTCFDGGVNTKVTCWLTEDANLIICREKTILLTPDDYNSVSGVRNGDVKYVRGEDPEAGVVDLVTDSNNNTEALLVAAQGDITDILADTDELQGDWTDGGRLDLLLDLVLTELAETEVNAVLTKGYALAAQTAAEKIDTASELRTLLNATGEEIATEPNQTLIKAVTDALPSNGALTSIVADANKAAIDANTAAKMAPTALSSAVWTNTKAGYIDMKISDVNAGSAGAAVLLTTTVADPCTAIEFSLTDGPDTNDAYINNTIRVTDADASGYPEERKIISYTIVGGVKWVMVDLPFSFTPDAGDIVVIPGAGYAPSGAGWGMNIPSRMFDYVFAARRYVKDFIHRSERI